jgi:hypothetical protein
MHTPSNRQLSDKELGEQVERIYEAPRRTYGLPGSRKRSGIGRLRLQKARGADHGRSRRGGSLQTALEAHDHRRPRGDEGGH